MMGGPDECDDCSRFEKPLPQRGTMHNARGTRTPWSSDSRPSAPIADVTMLADVTLFAVNFRVSP
ncbi:hypothetical protein BS47DRAFT_1346408 [Hydnum rufescens UP504]|uniref:Uncharacterized protein n=1 Tax=Hydnum rufescens UP504 TaxID=1448309 RepID=A0A9P6ATK2_9AGAM|nr:hypothetical protein BS47DRAFT_1346408 [Hydnum rufescens UP504]